MKNGFKVLGVALLFMLLWKTFYHHTGDLIKDRTDRSFFGFMFSLTATGLCGAAFAISGGFDE